MLWKYKPCSYSRYLRFFPHVYSLFSFFNLAASAFCRHWDVLCFLSTMRIQIPEVEVPKMDFSDLKHNTTAHARPQDACNELGDECLGLVIAGMGHRETIHMLSRLQSVKSGANTLYVKSKFISALSKYFSSKVHLPTSRPLLPGFHMLHLIKTHRKWAISYSRKSYNEWPGRALIFHSIYKPSFIHVVTLLIHTKVYIPLSYISAQALRSTEDNESCFSSALLRNLMWENFHYSLCIYSKQGARVPSEWTTWLIVPEPSFRLLFPNTMRW